MKSLLRKLFMGIHYSFYSFLNNIVPKNENIIFIYDAPFMRQNCWALYFYLMSNGFADKYDIYYYCEKYRDHYGDSIKQGVVSNPFMGWILHLIARYTFYEYQNFKYCCKPGKYQTTVFLTHGMPFKNYGYLIDNPPHPYEDDYTFLLMTSEYYIPIMKQILGCSDAQIYVGGMPRCDQLNSNRDLSCLLDFEKRIVLWMPTFRKSKENSINDSANDFPILNEEIINGLNETLSENNICLVIKPHPLQDTIPWLYDTNFSNIRLLFNDDLERENIELYELLGQVDLLLTDYSSVYSDFLITDKPLAFVIDDFDEYSQKRGFVDQKLLDMLPGPVATNYSDFINIMKSIDEIKVKYKEKRDFANSLLNKESKTGNFSCDLCDFLGIVL